MPPLPFGTKRRPAAADALRLHPGCAVVRQTLAKTFGLDEEQIRVVAENVGGGFGSKGAPHSHNVLAVMAAQRVGGRPVKLALTRQQMFAVVGYRTPTISHVRLGAERDGTLTAISHEVVEQTATVKEFAEQTAVRRACCTPPPPARLHTASPKLDVAVPFGMRAPGECPGVFALEVAMDELADRLRRPPDRPAHPQRTRGRP